VEEQLLYKPSSYDKFDKILTKIQRT